MSKAAKQPSKQLVHEINHTLRQHRLVITGGGRPDSSEWFDSTKLGTYRGYFFQCEEKAGLPSGVFTISRRPFEVLA